MQPLALLTLACLCLCGAPRHGVRESATRALHSLSDWCPALVLAGEQHPDPEVRRRCKIVADAWYARHAAELVDRLEPAIGWPWCDSLNVFWDQGNIAYSLSWSGDWNLSDSKRFLALAHAQGYPPGHPWNAYREGMRRWVQELIAQRRDVAYFLRCMCEGHLQQARHYQYLPRHGVVAFERIAAPKGAE